MRYRVTVTQSQVYHVDAHSERHAEIIGLHALQMQMPPDYTMDPHAEAEREYGEMTVEEATEEKHASGS